MKLSYVFLWSTLFVGTLFPNSSPAFNVTGVWDTNYNAMNLWQNGVSVNGEYVYNNAGVLLGTLSENIFQGWWREKTQSCGPNNAWSGAVVFKFSTDGLSFTGDWTSCSDTRQLDPDGSRWTGTKRNTGYTQTDCENSGRFWCDGSCRLTNCAENITEQSCLSSGRNWCGGICQITDCAATITEPDCKLNSKYWCNGICQVQDCTTVPGCSPATLSEDLKMHIPVLNYTPVFGVPMSLWADLVFIPEQDKIKFEVINYGVNPE